MNLHSMPFLEGRRCVFEHDSCPQTWQLAVHTLCSRPAVGTGESRSGRGH